jgi:hypothetical protein
MGSISARVGGVSGVVRDFKVQATESSNPTSTKTNKPNNSFFFICFSSFQGILQTVLAFVIVKPQVCNPSFPL